MSGTVLGQDQINKINALYGQLFYHIKATLGATSTPFEKMRAYLAVEYLNTTELAAIFEQLPYISPAEKRALVRAAIDDVRLGTEVVIENTPATDNAGVVAKDAPEAPQRYSPPPFKLNVITTLDHKVV